MKKIELNKMGLCPLTETEIQKIEGGGFWQFYEKAGYVIGMVIGTTLRLSNDMAKKLFERSAIK